MVYKYQALIHVQISFTEEEFDLLYNAVIKSYNTEIKSMCGQFLDEYNTEEKKTQSILFSDYFLKLSIQALTNYTDEKSVKLLEKLQKISNDRTTIQTEQNETFIAHSS